MRVATLYTEDPHDKQQRHAHGSGKKVVRYGSAHKIHESVMPRCGDRLLWEAKGSLTKRNERSKPRGEYLTSFWYVF